MAKQKLTPRGIRNNNPLNIRIGNTWLGEEPNPTDSEFEQFVSPFYGLRAAFIILRRYIRRYRRDTIRKIIAAWAPANENNVTAYVDAVSRLSGIDPDAQIDYFDKDTMVSIVAAMARVECGQEIDIKNIIAAYDAA